MSNASAQRPYIDKTQPEVYAALTSAARASRAASEAAGLDTDLLELVNVRASQINGCVTCLSIHVPAARRAGVEDLKIDLLPAWRDALVYTGAERVALALTEAITCPHERDLTQAQAEAAEHFSTEALAALEWSIILINSFNRVSIASGHPPRRPRPQE